MLYTDRLTDHWKVDELCRRADWPSLSRDETAQNHLRRLAVTALEPLRILCGCPLVAISGFRSPAHNAKVGGAQASQHMLGRAADIAPADVEWWKLRAHFLHKPGFEEFTAKMARDQERIRQLDLLVEHTLARELVAVGGVGLYEKSGWVHLDIRCRGSSEHVARWRGNDFGSEQ
jgi:uncharacterized protein YcbK (DUF882 family)